MQLKTRLLILLVPTIIAALVLLSVYGYTLSSRQAAELAKVQAQKLALEQSDAILSKLRHAETAASALAAALAHMTEVEKPDRPTMNLAVKGVMTASAADFFGVWALWEPNAFDGQDKAFVGDEDYGNEEGRANAYWLREGNAVVYNLSRDFDDQEYYSEPLRRGRLFAVPPYRDMDTEGHILMTSITAPIMRMGRALGVAGVDIELEFIQQLIDKVRPHETGYAALVSDQGAVIAAPKEVLDALPSSRGDLPMLPPEQISNLHQGKPFSLPGNSKHRSEDLLFFQVPFKLAAFNGPWHFIVALPQNKVMAESRSGLYIQMGLSLGALIVLVLLLFRTAGIISAPLRRVVAYAQAVAGGKHDAVLEQKGFVLELQDLAAALRSMLDSLLVGMAHEEHNRQVLIEAEKAKKAMAEAENAQAASEAARQAMLDVARRVTAVSEKLQQASHQLTDKLTLVTRENGEQNHLVGETVSAVSALSASTTRVSGNAGEAAEAADRTVRQAAASAGVVNSTIGAFEGIRLEAEGLGREIEELSKQTDSIGGILGMINDIADQTNLLALNAAIEAARAGEAGRGFAVVADEVRKLAEKTVNATKEVDASLKGLQNSMQISARGVSRTMDTVRSTLELGNQAKEALDEIVTLVRGMSEQIHGIAGLCGDQAATVGQIRAMAELLGRLSATVKKTMEESTCIAETLRPEADTLVSLAEQLSKETQMHPHK